MLHFLRRYPAAAIKPRRRTTMHWFRSHSRLGSWRRARFARPAARLVVRAHPPQGYCSDPRPSSDGFGRRGDCGSDEHATLCRPITTHHEHEDQYCAIYAINSLLGSAQHSEPPALPLPPSVERAPSLGRLHAPLARPPSCPLPGPRPSHRLTSIISLFGTACAHAQAAPTSRARCMPPRSRRPLRDRRGRSLPASRCGGQMSIRISRLLLLGSSALMSLHCLGRRRARANHRRCPRSRSPRRARSCGGRRRARPRAAPTTARRTATAPRPRDAGADANAPDTGRDRARPAAGHAADRHRPVRDRHRRHPPPKSSAAPAQNLGDVMFSKPGITSTTTAPGASRPVIRGQDNFRVRIQENGIAIRRCLRHRRGPRRDHRSAGGRADRGDPRTGDACAGARRRSAASSTWTTTAFPPAIPPRRLSPQTQRRRHHGRQRRRGRGAARRRQRQFRLPCRRLRPARRRLPHPQLSLSVSRPTRRRPSTAASRTPSLRTGGSSVGGSYLFDGGFVGVAVSHFASLYRLPGIEPTETGTRIDLHQTKITSKGEFRPQASAIDAIRFWLGASRLQARRARLRERLRRRAADLHQQDRGGSRRGAVGAGQPVVRGAHHRARRAGRAT